MSFTKFCLSVFFISSFRVYFHTDLKIYRVSINSFPDYKHLLQENYVGYKYIFLPLLNLVSKTLCHVFIVMLQLHVCIPRGFLVINVCNQGKILCSPCILQDFNEII